MRKRANLLFCKRLGQWIAASYEYDSFPLFTQLYFSGTEHFEIVPMNFSPMRQDWNELE